jgi:hypothetical protein
MNPIRFPTTRRHITALAGSALLGLALAPVAAQAQAPAWPTEPVRLVLSAPRAAPPTSSRGCWPTGCRRNGASRWSSNPSPTAPARSASTSC